MPKSGQQQPWALLYNLESKLSQQPPDIRRKKGRPPAPIPRAPTMMKFTSEERRTLQILASRLQQQFPSAKITRSQVAGFSFHLLTHMMDRAGSLDGIEEWNSLWQRLLDSAEAEEKSKEREL